EGLSAARASPARQKSRDFANVRTNQYEESTGTSTVKNKWGLTAGGIQAAVAADGRRAGDRTFLDTFRMADDQADQVLPIH
ncbi:MAG: hypothetical protein ACLP9L_28370, partial [Thermoguttaceae bacterium]